MLLKTLSSLYVTIGIILHLAQKAAVTALTKDQSGQSASAQAWTPPLIFTFCQVTNVGQRPS